MYTNHILNIRGSLNKFLDFFVWARLLSVHTWNSCPLRNNLLRLQCTCYTVPPPSGRLRGSPLVWACQWPSPQPFSPPQLSHNDSLWAKGITKRHREPRRVRNCLDAHIGQIVCDKDGVVNCYIVLVEIPLSRFEECWLLSTESLPELP